MIEGADSLEMKLMAEQHAKEEAEEHEHEHHHEHDENCTCGCHDHEHDHDHEDHDHEDHDHEHHHDHDHEPITIMKTMTTIMNMTKTAPVDAMTTIIITIMQMKCLQAGAKRLLTNSRRKRLRMY